jgi:hypothetical protein
VKIIRHRRNTLAELAATPTDLGVEVDLRSHGGELILHHDPFTAGERFERWLSAYRHDLLVLNVKEEGLEERVLESMKRRGIESFFFLDQSFPFLVRTARAGERRCAVRVSEFESIDTALALADHVDWVWVDCFSRFPLDGAGSRALQEAGLSLCLVSPELQGHPTSRIAELRRQLREQGIAAEAVYTKEPDAWR